MGHTCPSFWQQEMRQYLLLTPWHHSPSHFWVYGLCLFHHYPLFFFPRTLAKLVPNWPFAPPKAAPEDPMTASVGPSFASVSINDRVARHADHIKGATLRCCLCYTTTPPRLFCTNHLAPLEMNNDTVPLTFSTCAKTVALVVIEDFHCTFVLMQSNADSHDAFTNFVSWQSLYTIEHMPTTVLTRQTRFLRSLCSVTFVSF